MTSLPPQLDFPKTEEEICANWAKNETFKTQDRLSRERGDEEYSFYDGPPFATGLPHYGHILAGTIKDVVTRYACMNGYQVTRRAGWDCHGLPVEYEIDQMLNITHRDQVLEMGIDKYNATCRGIVTRYTSEWETTITRLGRWIDFKNDYKTMDANFMESVWWVFQTLFDKGLVYQGYKVMPFSTACGTPISNFEAGLNYKDVRDPAVVVSFPVVGMEEEGVNLVAWTTTPWTLPSNLALCVHPTLEYIQILDKKSGKRYVLAKSRVSQLYPQIKSKKFKKETLPDIYTVEKTFVGKDLVGWKYQPLFDFFANEPDSPQYFRVLSDTYVTDDSGTGIVHQAPAFGEDDYRVCIVHKIIIKGGEIPCPVDSNGIFTAKIPPVQGKNVKDADETLIALVKAAGRLVQKDNYDHSYPFCWRSDTPLIYKAVPSWFVRVEEIRDKIVANNKDTYWVPGSVKTGRFHAWLTDARDWAVSRNRFWGTPIPIWANEDMSEVICIGSVEQLFKLSGVKVTDLHRETIDSITIPSQKTPGQVLKRIDEVFDCWFESGSMPYAQKHYPFENKELFEKTFPADFIAEGIDQTRGWFYTLMVLSTALFDKPAFKNLIANGMVLASDGKKMSKRLKNYPEPTVIINKYGADAVRMYLINSPVVRAESLKFQESGVFGVLKEVFLPWYNAFRLFLQNIERWELDTEKKFIASSELVDTTTNPTDIWMLAATQNLIQFVRQEMDAYRLYTVMPALVSYVTQLTNWYVRLNRDRLKGIVGNSEAEIALQVFYDILLDVTVLMAPFTPFLTEYLYQFLRKLQPSYPEAANGGGTSLPVKAGKSDSVHFLHLPKFNEGRMNEDAVAAMKVLQGIVEQGRNVREKRTISTKYPVKQVVIIMRNPSASVVEAIKGPLSKYILSELNAWDLKIVPKEEEKDWVKMSMLPNSKLLGKKLGKKMGMATKIIKGMTHEEALACLELGELKIDDTITINTATEILSKLDFAKENDPQWEATASPEGDLVVAVDCHQDADILDNGKSRELVNHTQMLRKNAGLSASDTVEVFFAEDVGDSMLQAVAKNAAFLQGKLRGVTPLPKALCSPFAVTLGSDTVDVGGTKLEVSITQPCVSPKDGAEEAVLAFLRTLDPLTIAEGQVETFLVDGKEYVLTEGTDFWSTAVRKAKSLKTLDWLS